jgi:hypothetical protein
MRNLERMRDLSIIMAHHLGSDKGSLELKEMLSKTQGLRDETLPAV